MRPFVGQREELLNQAAGHHVTILWHAAGEDDEMLTGVTIRELVGLGQIEAVVKHFRQEAETGDPASMKALFQVLLQAGGEDDGSEGMALLERIADSGDAWGIATRERARAHEREHAPTSSGFGPEFDRFVAGPAAANGEQMTRFYEYCDPEGYDFGFGDGKLIGRSDGPDLSDITVLGTFSHSSQTWLWMWANESWGWDWDHPALRSLRRVYDLGVEHGIPEIVEPGIDLSDRQNPHAAANVLAISVGGLLGVRGVWSCRINDGEGSLYIHCGDPRIPRADYDRSTVEALLRNTAQLFPSHQREIVRGYFGHHGLQVGESIDRVTATGPGEPGITVRFDAANQIVSIG
jgi:hypothetical protein